MRKKICLPLLLLLFFSAQTIAQKIMMRIPAVMDKAEEVTTLSLDIEAISSWIKGGGASVGKPTPGSLVVRKSYSKATADLLKNISVGKSIAEVIFEYYDQGAKPFYTIAISGAFLTKLSWLTPDCSNCPKIAQEISFVYKTLKTTDIATGTTVTWDIPAGTVQ